ncbi:MAG: hypothetical protein JOZ38_07495 [Candidatus Eremiobacteraeota bacterium]|nr:hypothetical protein [Candidatus Eremiobacteraeota bacterium]
MKHLVLTSALLLAFAATAAAQQNRCTSETLQVRGTPVTIALCVTALPKVAPAREMPVEVTETFTTARASFTRLSSLRFISGQSVSRVIEDVDLGGLRIDGTLHLTLELAGGSVRIEGAILTPGAITVK